MEIHENNWISHNFIFADRRLCVHLKIILNLKLKKYAKL